MNKVYSLEDILEIVWLYRDIPSIESETINKNWIENATEIGRCGEEIALRYLEIECLKVIETSGDNSLGYDIWADNQIYEIKTTTNIFNTFEITINELKSAFKYKQKSNLFFIKLQKEKAKGYIIQNLFKSLDILWNDVFNLYYNEKVELSNTKIKMTLSDNFMSKKSAIDLTHFYLGIADLRCILQAATCLGIYKSPNRANAKLI